MLSHAPKKRLNSVLAFRKTKAGGIQSAGSDPVTMRRRARVGPQSADSGRTGRDSRLLSLQLSIGDAPTAAPPPPLPREAGLTDRTWERAGGRSL